MAAPTAMRAAGCATHRPALATILKPCRAVVPSPFHGVAVRRSVLARAEGLKKPAYEFDADNLVSDLKEKWDAVEDKSTVITYGVGALILLWVSSSIVGVVNSIPLVPKAMELVGLVYSAWFVYRYLLFKSSREELLADIESLKQKISGDSSAY